MKLLAIPVLVLPAAAIAQAPTAPQASPRSSDERICRTSGEFGSGPNRTRTCTTRAQWEGARREDRDAIDRAQRQWNPTVDEVPGGN